MVSWTPRSTFLDVPMNRRSPDKSSVIRKLLLKYAKKRAHISSVVTPQLISAFVFTTSDFLNPKYQASNHGGMTRSYEEWKYWCVQA